MNEYTSIVPYNEHLSQHYMTSYDIETDLSIRSVYIKSYSEMLCSSLFRNKAFPLLPSINRECTHNARILSVRQGGASYQNPFIMSVGLEMLFNCSEKCTNKSEAIHWLRSRCKSMHNHVSSLFNCLVAGEN